MHWDAGNEFFPPTSFQVSNVASGTGANNVVPGEMTVEFNFRFSTESSETSLRSRTEEVLARHNIDHQIDWKLSGPPFITRGGKLISVVQDAIAATMKLDTELSTAGGTSDGRFIAPRGIEVVELGPCNATIHKVNERLDVNELNQLSGLYEEILIRLFPVSSPGANPNDMPK